MYRRALRRCRFYLLSMDEQTELYAKQELRNLGSRLKEIRKEKHSAAEFFAYEQGISRAQYAKYEAGANISFLTLAKLIKAHGMTIAEFFSEGFDLEE